MSWVQATKHLAKAIVILRNLYPGNWDVEANRLLLSMLYDIDPERVNKIAEEGFGAVDTSLDTSRKSATVAQLPAQDNDILLADLRPQQQDYKRQMLPLEMRLGIMACL